MAGIKVLMAVESRSRLRWKSRFGWMERVNVVLGSREAELLDSV